MCIVFLSINKPSIVCFKDFIFVIISYIHSTLNNDIIQRVDNNSIVTVNVSSTKLQRWQGNRRHRFRNLPQLRHGPHQPQLERHRGGAGAGGPQVEDRRDGGGHHPLAGAGRQGLVFLNFDLDTFGNLLLCYSFPLECTTLRRV